MPEYISALKEPAGAYALLLEQNWEEAMYLAEGALKGNVIQTFPRGVTTEAGLATTFPLGKWVEVTRKEDGSWELEYTPDFRLPEHILADMERKAQTVLARGGGDVYRVPGESLLALIQEVRNRRREDAAPLDTEDLTRRLTNTIWGENTADAQRLGSLLVNVVRDWMDGTPYTTRSERKSR